MTPDLVQALFDLPVTRAAGWALVHSTWQEAAIAGLAGFALVALRRRSANARYVAGVAALAAMLIAPMLTAAVAWRAASNDLRAMGAPAVRGNGLGAALPTDRVLSPDARTSTPAPPGGTTSASIDTLFPWLLTTWFAGVLLLSVRLVAAWSVVQRRVRQARTSAESHLVRRVQRLSARIGVTRRVRVLVSTVVDGPCAIGVLRPVILVPVGALAGMPPEQVEAILAHELAHIRRHDYLVNLVQTGVETLLFYHPAVWWVSHRVRVEREHCCDDVAVAVCGSAVSYARALAALEGLRATATLALAATATGLLGRVRRVMGIVEPVRGGLPVASGVLAFALIVGLVLGGTASVAASDRQAPPVPPPPPAPEAPQALPAPPPALPDTAPQAVRPPTPTPAARGIDTATIADLRVQLAATRQQLADLQARLASNHPAVVRMRRTVRYLENRLEALLPPPPPPAPRPPADTPPPPPPASPVPSTAPLAPPVPAALAPVAAPAAPVAVAPAPMTPMPAPPVRAAAPRPPTPMALPGELPLPTAAPAPAIRAPRTLPAPSTPMAVPAAPTPLPAAAPRPPTPMALPGELPPPTAAPAPAIRAPRTLPAPSTPMAVPAAPTPLPAAAPRPPTPMALPGELPPPPAAPAPAIRAPRTAVPAPPTPMAVPAAPTPLPAAAPRPPTPMALPGELPPPTAAPAPAIRAPRTAVPAPPTPMAVPAAPTPLPAPAAPPARPSAARPPAPPPPAHTPPAATAATAPPPVPTPAPSLGFDRLRAQMIEQAGDTWICSGMVELEAEGWTFVADGATYDRTTRTLVLRGNVKITVPSPASADSMRATQVEPTSAGRRLMAGSVRFEHNGWRVFAEEAEWHADTRTLMLKGDVTVQRPPR